MINLSISSVRLYAFDTANGNGWFYDAHTVLYCIGADYEWELCIETEIPLGGINVEMCTYP